MSTYGYMMKYKGVYTLSVPYDLEKKQFVRGADGNFENYFDVRVECANHAYILHKGGNVLIACCDNVRQKENILRKLPPEIILDRDYNWYDFTFRDKDMGQVASAMRAKTTHKNRSPYSVKNLPPIEYAPKNPELCQQVKELIIAKYGLGKYNPKMQEYLRKFKIKTSPEERLKAIYLLDKFEKLEKILKLENGN